MLRRDDAVLVVIDVQERLLPFIHESEHLVRQIVRLVRGFGIVEAPVVATEQYRKGLGPTHPDILEAVAQVQDGSASADYAPIEKMTFSCVAHDPFLEHLRNLGRRQVVLCGIESHVCVLQTAIHLVEARFETFVAADAVSSRSHRNLEIAVKRMEQEGVTMTSVEMAVFEMLQACGTPPFKAWSQLIR